MAKGKAVLTQAELTRYLKAYRNAGIPVVRAEISRDGSVVIHSSAAAQEAADNPWDAP